MGTKDILLVRMSSFWNDLSEEHKDKLDIFFNEKFKDLYNVLVIYGENKTEKTNIEIIRYND